MKENLAALPATAYACLRRGNCRCWCWFSAPDFTRRAPIALEAAATQRDGRAPRNLVSLLFSMAGGLQLMRFLMCLICAAMLAAGAAMAQQAATGWLGAELKDLTKEEADALGWDEPRGGAASARPCLPGNSYPGSQRLQLFS